MLFKGRNLYTLNEGRVIKSFGGLLSNLEKLTYSTYICELIDIATEENEKNAELYRYFLTCIYLLETDAIDYENLIRSFELKMLKATGYGLNLDNCVICKKQIKTSDYMHMSYFGGICSECEKTNGIKISKAAYNAIKFLNNTSMDKVYRLSLSQEIKEEVEKINTMIISSIYARKPKSLEMLKYI